MPDNFLPDNCQQITCPKTYPENIPRVFLILFNVAKLAFFSCYGIMCT
nr:MAG TPA: RWD domain [Caudoviricetes sp.]